MLLFSETGQQLDVNVLKSDLLKANALPVPSLEEIQTDLGTYYRQALLSDLKSNNVKFESLDSAFAADAKSLLSIGSGLLDKIRKIICKLLNGSSTTQDIVDAILNAIASVIPGGIVLKGLLEKLIKYILSTGITKFCSIA